MHATPLEWPAGWPRTEQRELAHFKISADGARNQLLHQLELLGATGVVISSNVPTRRDGYPYAGMMERTCDDPGVAVYFDLNGETRCIPCDRWKTPAQNLRAIGKTIEALRGIERWAAGDMMHAAFAGFASLPTGTVAQPDTWWAVLELESPNVPADVVRTQYRKLARRYHPDVQGGSHEHFLHIQRAYESAQVNGSM